MPVFALTLKPISNNNVDSIRLQPGRSCTVGASPAADYPLDSAGIAGIHCRITCHKRFVFIECLAVELTVEVNEAHVNRSRIVHQDRLKIGSVEYLADLPPEKKIPKIETPIDFEDLFESSSEDILSPDDIREGLGDLSSTEEISTPSLPTKQTPDEVVSEKRSAAEIPAADESLDASIADTDFPDEIEGISADFSTFEDSSERFDDLDDDFYAIDESELENLPSTLDVHDIPVNREKKKSDKAKNEKASHAKPEPQSTQPENSTVAPESAETESDPFFDPDDSIDIEVPDDTPLDELEPTPTVMVSDVLTGQVDGLQSQEKYRREQGQTAWDLVNELLSLKEMAAYQPEQGFVRHLPDFDLNQEFAKTANGVVLLISRLDSTDINRFVSEKRWHDRIRYPLGLLRFLDLSPQQWVDELFEHVVACFIFTENKRDFECYTSANNPHSDQE